MLHFNELRIGTKLIAVTLALVIIPLLITSILTYTQVRKRMMDSVEQNLVAEVNSYKSMAQSQDDASTATLQQDLTVVDAIQQKYGTFTLTTESAPVIASNPKGDVSHELTVPEMRLGNTTVKESSSFVDEVHRLVGADCSVTQVVPGGLLQVSTTLVKKDGSRGIDVLIPTDSTMFTCALNGNTCFGVTCWLGVQYKVCAKPILQDGKVIGVIVMGNKVNDVFKVVYDKVHNTRIGKTGYTFIMGTKGEEKLFKFMHPTEEGKYTNTAHTKIMVAQKEGTIVYKYKNPETKKEEKKIAVYCYYEPLD
jgi:methyl-accepting chemotaxis protein